MSCHAQNLPEESELQQAVKTDEVFQFLGYNEAVEFQGGNTPNESMMDVEYLQNDNSSSKSKHTENILENYRRQSEVDGYDKTNTDRTLKQFLNFSGPENNISGNKENKLRAEQENVMGSGEQSKEENGRRDCFVSAEICVCVSDVPGEMLNEQIVHDERQKTGVLKKSPEVEMIHKTRGKKISRQAASDVSTKEEGDVQSETNFALTTKKNEVTPKSGKHALDISPYQQQHFSPISHFELQPKEHCFTDSNSCNTLNSEDRELEVCGEKEDSLLGTSGTVTLEIASSFRGLAVHHGSEKTKLILQSVSDPDFSGSVERDTNKLHRVPLDKTYSIAENKILEKSNINPNDAKNTMREMLAVSSENISGDEYAAKVSESYPLDVEVSPVHSDPSLGIKFLGNAGDLNTNIDELEQGQKCKDLLLVAEMDSRDKGHSTKGPGKNMELQKTFNEKTGKNPSLETNGKQKKRGNDNEEESHTNVEVLELLCNASETVNLRMILNQPKSTFEFKNMPRSSDLKLIKHNLNNEYANGILITMYFEMLKFLKFLLIYFYGVFCIII